MQLRGYNHKSELKYPSDYNFGLVDNIINYSLVKKRNEIIIMFYGKVEQSIQPEDIVTTAKVKTPRQPQVKPMTNDDLILEIIDFLNECTGKSYKATSKVATININARLKEGYTKDDFVIDNTDGLVIIDSMSMQYLTGSTIDYKEDLNGSSFVIQNPGATSTCGCGSSFSV